MNELHDKTLQQLNMMVAEIKFPECSDIIPSHKDTAPVAVYWPPKDGSILPSRCKRFDWINDDALAFRLMVDNNLEAKKLPLCGDWSVSSYLNSDDLHYSINKCLRRAIVECFILMNQHKEG